MDFISGLLLDENQNRTETYVNVVVWLHASQRCEEDFLKTIICGDDSDIPEIFMCDKVKSVYSFSLESVEEFRNITVHNFPVPRSLDEPKNCSYWGTKEKGCFEIENQCFTFGQACRLLLSVPSVLTPKSRNLLWDMVSSYRDKIENNNEVLYHIKLRLRRFKLEDNFLDYLYKFHWWDPTYMKGVSR